MSLNKQLLIKKLNISIHIFLLTLKFERFLYFGFSKIYIENALC